MKFWLIASVMLAVWSVVLDEYVADHPRFHRVLDALVTLGAVSGLVCLTVYGFRWALS